MRGIGIGRSIGRYRPVLALKKTDINSSAITALALNLFSGGGSLGKGFVCGRARTGAGAGTCVGTGTGAGAGTDTTDAGTCR